MLKKTMRIAAMLCILLLAVILYCNLSTYLSTRKGILSEENALELSGGDYDCILVLGCSVHPDQTPSVMLRSRVETAVALYQAGVCPKILMSGDHQSDDYNEVQVMKDLAVGMGVPREDIFMDHRGCSTYASMVRAREVFGAGRILLVSQKYHLYRASYIARKLGMEPTGVCAADSLDPGQLLRELRETAARVKDFWNVRFGFEKVEGGPSVDLAGDGSQTDETKEARGLTFPDIGQGGV